MQIIIKDTEVFQHYNSSFIEDFKHYTDGNIENEKELVFLNVAENLSRRTRYSY